MHLILKQMNTTDYIKVLLRSKFSLRKRY